MLQSIIDFSVHRAVQAVPSSATTCPPILHRLHIVIWDSVPGFYLRSIRVQPRSRSFKMSISLWLIPSVLALDSAAFPA